MNDTRIIRKDGMRKRVYCLLLAVVKSTVRVVCCYAFTSLLHQTGVEGAGRLRYLPPFIYDLYNKEGIRIKTCDKKYLVSFMNRNDKKAEHLIIMNY